MEQEYLKILEVADKIVMIATKIKVYSLYKLYQLKINT